MHFDKNDSLDNYALYLYSEKLHDCKVANLRY